jgi:hypothetical protein
MLQRLAFPEFPPGEGVEGREGLGGQRAKDSTSIRKVGVKPSLLHLLKNRSAPLIHSLSPPRMTRVGSDVKFTLSSTRLSSTSTFMHAQLEHNFTRAPAPSARQFFTFTFTFTFTFAFLSGGALKGSTSFLPGFH